MTDYEMRKALGLDPESVAKTEALVRKYMDESGVDWNKVGSRLVKPSENTNPPPTDAECREFWEATSCQHGQDVWDCPCGVPWSERVPPVCRRCGKVNCGEPFMEEPDYGF